MDALLWSLFFVIVLPVWVYITVRLAVKAFYKSTKEEGEKNHVDA